MMGLAEAMLLDTSIAQNKQARSRRPAADLLHSKGVKFLPSQRIDVQLMHPIALTLRPSQWRCFFILGPAYHGGQFFSTASHAHDDANSDHNATYNDPSTSRQRQQQRSRRRWVKFRLAITAAEPYSLRVDPNGGPTSVWEPS